MTAVSAAGTYSAPIEDSFDFVTAEDVLPKVLHRYGPMPAVVRTIVLDGPEWDRSGCFREVHLDDGSMLHEQIDELERPFTFSYDVTPQTGMLRHVIGSARGEWEFTETNDRTETTWTYRFRPRSSLLTPVVWIFSKVFQRYMQAAQERISTQIAESR